MVDCSDPDAQIRKLQNYLDSMQVGTWEWNVQTGELVINERWAEIAGFSLADLSPVNIDVWTWLAHPDDLLRSNQALQDHFNGKSEYYELDVRIRHKNGNWIWVRDRGKVVEWTSEGQPLWMFGTHEDVSYRIDATRGVRESKLHEEQLLYAANHDALTGLLNRTALQRMSKQLIQGLPEQTTLSALLIDVDNFRGVNDTLGHQGGDQVLSELAQVIQTCSGSYNQVFRYSGDEFLVLTRLSDEDQVAKLARSIQAAVARQFKYKHQLVQITVSIGICLDEPGYSLDQVIIQADMALFVAKSTRNTVTFYRQSMAAARTRAEILSADLSTALDKGEFELYFQPIFDIQRNRFRHAEALLRWNHPILGQIAPGEFIPLAERTRLIIPMTDWVIREACKKLAVWKKAGFPDLAISVNLSAVALEYRRYELVKLILESIEQNQICPTCLNLEITESALVSDIHEVAELFGELKSHGVKVSLDDFGTGYATFGSLNDLPVDVVKLDRSLIRNLEHKDRERMVIDALFTVIHGLDLEVVVEGVETKAQYDWLCHHGCDFVQGFYFSKPLPEQAFLDFLSSAHPKEAAGESLEIGSAQGLSVSTQIAQTRLQPRPRSTS